MKIGRILRSPAGLLLALAADLFLFGGPHRPDARAERSLSAALAAHARVTADLIDLEAVVGTAVGRDWSGRHVVKVYLTTPGAAALPAFVGGVPVVPEVTGEIVALVPDGDPATAADDIDRKATFPRPVPIGVSTGHGDVTAGTIGARVSDGVRVYALSNNHVYAASNGGRKGDAVFQPGMLDGARDPDDALGTLHDFEPIAFCTGLVCPSSNAMDAALALVTTDDLGHSTPDDGYGTPRGAPVDPKVGLSVQKYGRTTGHTKGTISGIKVTIDVRYGNGTARFVDQVMISGGDFSNPGDSGSLIVTDAALFGDRRPVALLFAGSQTATIASPIGPVLERFGVRVDGGL